MQHIRTSVLVAPVLILLLFASSLAGIDRLGFRDVSHFYTPLYDYVASRTANQWLPLWNPLDQTGMPLVGETTTAVLYPVRYAVFSLPISTETAIAWYVALHLMLASATAWLAARWSGVGQVAATVAGVVYPLSGSVLFLYTNPPFVVGAAWLPLVLGVMLARVPISALVRIIIGGTSMSMMILGGDPQTALHAMIIVAAVWAIRLIRRKEVGVPGRVVIAVPILSAMLAAPQLAASISWSSQSDRWDEPQIERWIDPPLVGGKRHEAFQYSLAPWHMMELATPNAFGSLFPTNRRISRLIPGDGRTWTPSIYMGMLVLVAMLSRIWTIRESGVDPWMATALVSLWLAMGHFGVVWVIQSLSGSLRDVDSAIGGPYWWLYQLVPGYDSFRYPAKWLTLFSLAAAIVTAQTIDQSCWHRTFGRIAFYVALILAAAFALTVLLRWNTSIIFDPASKLPTDEFWGPLDIDAGLSQIGRSLVHSAIALLAIGLVVRFRKSLEWSDKKVKLCLLAIVLIDLGFCGDALVARVPRSREHELIVKIDPQTEPPESRWMRTQAGGGWPSVWKQTTDHDRMIDVEASVRAAWFGRWHLADRNAVLNNMVSIRSREMAMFWKATREVTAGMSPEHRDEFWASIRRWLSIDGVVHATTQSVRVPIDGRVSKMIDLQRVLQARTQPLRFHPHWTCSESFDLTSRSFADRLRIIDRSDGLAPPVVHAKPGRFNPREPLVPLSSEPMTLAAGLADATPDSPTPEASAYGSGFETETSDHDATIRLICSEPEEVEFRVQLKAPGLLTRPVYQDGHWVARYARSDDNLWEPVTVRRVDHLTQGVILPMGDYKLQFRYEPWWLGVSLAVTAVAWLGVIVTLVRSRNLGRRR